ncbi:MAG TPA: hypothetical protein DC049_01420 [Spirochaetia bacterium]|nr:hypothetical protein [Spirochaetia bacterium]
MMSPQGIFPEAKGIIVMGLHYPDACVERGGDTHPQDMGSYTVGGIMSTRLDELSYRLATFIEKKGFNAVPISASHIWRYKEYKKLNVIFAPDISNIYMPVVAGLADMGYSGLALTREYGAHNRFVTIITDAECEPTPLVKPGTNCDSCMLCKKNCPSQALSKEIDGECVLKIEDYEYTFPKKNLWRCAWGEHFDLDLDIELPDKVNEEVIIEYVKKYGRRGPEAGQCLKFCLPKNLRSFDKSYSRSPVRKYHITYNEEIEPRAVCDSLIAGLYDKGIELVAVTSRNELEEKGINPDEALPNAVSAITVGYIINDIKKLDTQKKSILADCIKLKIHSVCYDLCRDIEKLGFRSIMTRETDGTVYGQIIDSVTKNIFPAGVSENSVLLLNTVITRKKIPDHISKPVLEEVNKQSKITFLTSEIKNYAQAIGFDMIGISSAQRINSIADKIAPWFTDKKRIIALDKAILHAAWDPEISEELQNVKKTDDYLAGARSVIVLGLRFHKKTIERTGLPPAEAAGPFAFEAYETSRLCHIFALQVLKKLEYYGYRGQIVSDMLNTASYMATPHGLQPDLRSNRFAALAAGLGVLTVNGHIATRDFGLKQRFIAIVTDAVLEEDQLVNPRLFDLCETCGEKCIKACPVAAFNSQRISFNLEENSYSFFDLDQQKCDWSQRYALVKDSGFKYVGSETDIYPDKEITAENLSSALKKLHPIGKHRPVVAQPCLLSCPYMRTNEIEKTGTT